MFKLGSRWYLALGLIYWSVLLALSLWQANQEAVLFSTPYGDYFLQILIFPLAGFILLFGLALFRSENPSDSPLTKNVFLQAGLLILIVLLLYWASRSPLQANWLIVLGVLLILPLFYLGGVALVNPNALLSLVSLVFMLIALEFFFQAVPQLWPSIARSDGSNWGRIHADIPLQVTEADGISYYSNELGFRGQPPAPTHADIITLGDSFTYGLSAASPWPQRLGDKLDVTVFNLGINAASPPVAIPPLIKYGLPQNPRLVIYAYFEGNDFYPCDKPARPLGPRWSDSLILPDLFKTLELKLTQNLADDPITSALTPDMVTPTELTINNQSVLLTFAPAYVSTLLMDRAQLVESENWRIASNSLQRLQALVEAEGSTFLLVYIPERTRVYWPVIKDDPKLLTQLYQEQTYRWVSDQNCLLLIRSQPQLSQAEFVESLNQTMDHQKNLLADFAEANEMHFFDLTPALRTYAASGATLSTPLETHYNDDTNDVIATAIATYISEEVPLE